MHGGDEARDFLLGTTTEWEHWKDLLDPRFERHGAYLIPHGAVEWPTSGPWFVPDLPAADGPDAWHAEDALLVPLRASDGAAARHPLDRRAVRRPPAGRPQLEVLGAVAATPRSRSSTRRAPRRAVRHRAAVEHLLRVSSQLSTRSGAQEMFDAVCVAIRDALGFEKVMLFLPEVAGRRARPARHLRLAAGGARRAALRDARGARAAARPRAAARGLRPAARQAEALPLVPPALHGIYASAHQRPRAAGVGVALAGRPAARPRRRRRRRDLGRRPRRPPAADHRAPAGAARLRQPGQRRGRVRAPARAPAPPGRARPADRAAQPSRLRAAHRSSDLRSARRRRRCWSATSTTSSASTTRSATRPATRSCAASPTCCADHARLRRADAARRRGVRRPAARRRPRRGAGGRRAPAPRGARRVRRLPGLGLGLGRRRRVVARAGHRRRPHARRQPRPLRGQAPGPRPRGRPTTPRR